MANASNSKTKLGLIKEVVFGTTPATPSLATQKYTSANLNISTEKLLDDSKAGASARQYNGAARGNIGVAGSISGPLAYGAYDTLLESAMFGTWVSNVLKIGDTRTSLTIEEAQEDIGSYRIFRGMVGNSFSVETSTDGLANISFEMLGMSQELAAASLDADGYTDATYTSPFTHCGGEITEGGTPIAYVSSISLSVNQNMSAEYYWGSCVTGDLVPGRVEVTGTIEVGFVSQALMTKFVNGTASDLVFTLVDAAGNRLTFDLPNIQYDGADSAIDSGTGSRMVSLPFSAYYSVADGTSLVITREAAV